MTESTNKQVVLNYVEAFNQGDFAALEGLFTEDALVYGVLGWGGLDKVMPIWRMLHETFAITIHVDAIIEEGDTVAVRYTERGTSVGPYGEHAATGGSFEVVAMEWFVLRDGRIHRRWGARDSATQFRQMGLPLK